MKRTVSLMFFLFLVFSIFAFNASADVNINIGVNAPPIAFAAPPDVVVVPSGTSYVYMVPNTPGIYFYDGYWYRFYEGRWFRAGIYNGPWVYISASLVPLVVVDVPPDYVRYLPRGYHRIHYRSLDRHWREWRRDRHWNRYNWYRHQMTEREKHRREGYKPPRREEQKPPREGYKPPRGESKAHGEGFRPPQGGERGPAVHGREAQPRAPHKAEQKGHKPKGEHEKKGGHGEER